MAFEVKFDLSDSDLEYFRGVMKSVQAKVSGINENLILENAQKLSRDVKGGVPEFVLSRLQKLETLVAMVHDKEWAIPAEERADVINALAYFSDPEDLVPDAIPALGFLDDAIMIELVVQELADDIEAFTDFCKYRERELARASGEVITQEDWLEAKRRELHSRMRNRRRDRSGRSSFRSIF